MKTHSLVYLAGPITGITWGDTTSWREYVKRSLPSHIHTLSPLRGKQYLEERSSEDGKILDSYEEYPLSSQKGINARDHWDASRSDAILVNLLGATTVSIGTVMEIAWGFTHGIPLILVMEDQGNIHEHAMLRESINYRVNSLEKAIEVIISLLSSDQKLEDLLMNKREEMLNKSVEHLIEALISRIEHNQ